MPRGATFLGSLRSILGPSRSGSQKLDDTAAASAPRATLSIVSESTTPKLAPMFDEDIGHVSGASEANGVKTPTPRSVVPKAFHRTFFSRSYKRTQSPTTVSEVSGCFYRKCLCHCMTVAALGQKLVSRRCLNKGRHLGSRNEA